ncbi:spondin-2-like [Anneissia japonica]|uniref:spondin-2-like n=1 Tax=Anneissia japonica TaxID=1529436 RepID=UPI001425502C|nr:spondin-2-like [Anneissia japonica]
MSFDANWSQRLFPKHYPLYRKHAQWSPMIGATHTENFHIWQIGHLATKGLKRFAEDGLTSHLTDELSQNSAIFSVFGANALSEGTGTSSAVFALHSKTTKISLVVKIIPSPDWFVGVDSINLHDGLGWSRSAKFNLYPIDAGTDKGLAFTSPNFAESPAKCISRIYWNRPSHPASSFRYPTTRGLPPLGQLTFSEISAGEFDKLKMSQKYRLNSIVMADRWKETSDIDLSKLANILGEKKHTFADQPKDLPIITDCKVTPWGRWSKCDKRRCGVGILKRFRYIKQAPTHDGNACPTLVEMKPCSLQGLNSKRIRCIKSKLEKETRKYTKKQRKRFGYKV